MMHRIERFGVGQTAKVFGILYGIMGLIFLPFFMLISAALPAERHLGMGYALSMPLLYGVMGFISTAIACAIYNVVAGAVGGIEIETDQVPRQASWMGVRGDTEA